MKNFFTVIGTVAVSAITNLTNSYHCLILVLVLLMIFDYITGIMVAYFNQQLESKKGLKGILKKIAFIMLVVLGFFADIVITYLVQKIGIKMSTNGVFGIATTCWLISNESLSVIENLGQVGVPIPNFLKNAFTELKDISENMTADKK